MKRQYKGNIPALFQINFLSLFYFPAKAEKSSKCANRLQLLIKNHCQTIRTEFKTGTEKSEPNMPHPMTDLRSRHF